MVNLQNLALGLGAAVGSLLLVIWWRQQTYRWPIVMAVLLLAAPLLSWWSGTVFQVPDYRAGCDGLCPGFRGAPVPFFRSEVAGGSLLPAMFVLNSLVYLLLLLAWSALLRALAVTTGNRPRGQGWQPFLLGTVLLLGPLAMAPAVVPAPEARVRGDPLRIAINARREVYLYDDLARAPVLRVALDDVRPRLDGQMGMRVCLRTYTFFYMPTGYMYLDMTPEGVHSNSGGVLAPERSCWQ